MANTITCECGWSVTEVSDDELWIQVRRHYQEAHGKYITRAEIMAKAKPASAPRRVAS